MPGVKGVLCVFVSLPKRKKKKETKELYMFNPTCGWNLRWENQFQVLEDLLCLSFVQRCRITEVWEAPNRCVLHLESRDFLTQAGSSSSSELWRHGTAEEKQDVARLSALSKCLHVRKQGLAVIAFSIPRRRTHLLDNTNESGLFGFAWTFTREGDHVESCF